MTPPSHAALGYILASNFKVPTKHQQLFTYITIAAALIPDTDVFWMGLTNHRNSILHTPIFWLTLAGSLYITGRLLHRPLLSMLSTAVLLGSISHLLVDMINPQSGIRIFYPISNIDPSFAFVTPLLKGITSTISFYSFFVLTEIIVLYLAFRTHQITSKQNTPAPTTTR